MIYLYQRVLYKRGLFLLEGGFLTVKQPYNTTIYNTALYLRLSRDDELQGESGSIQTLSLIHISLIVGLPASIFACRKMSIGAFAGNVVPYKFPVLEMGLFILVLFGMELILSVWTIRRQKKQSLIEQMRAME